MLGGKLKPGLRKAKLSRAEFWCRETFSLRGNHSQDRVGRPKKEGDGMIEHFHLGRFREMMERMRLWQVSTVSCDGAEAQKSERQQQYRDPPHEHTRGAILKHWLTLLSPIEAQVETR